ncbi:MAG: hypothetical protein R3F59_01920 [Myxococcota bacterium]
MLYHLVARARPGRLLFTDWEEGVALSRRIVAAIPGIRALVLMPDHVHLLHDQDVRQRLARALAAHARWRNARHGLGGSLVAPLPRAERLVDAQKVRRSVRYVHLNPCRAGLVDDPLAWPLSTHRDAVGLAADPVVARHREPARFHRYVSSDPTVDVEGTDLPCAGLALLEPVDVLYATSAALRLPLVALRRRGPGRTLFLRAARTLTGASHQAIADLVGVRRKTVCGVRDGDADSVRIVAAVAGDPRFAALDPGDLRHDPAWSAYRRRR